MIGTKRFQGLFTGAGLIILLLFSGLYSPRIKPRLQAAPPNQDGNLIQNPGFEGNFSAWSGIPEVQVASNWTPWWWDNPGHDPAYFRPEYKRALASVFSKRVLSGSSAQQWFTFHASHLAGMYQQVFNVIPGQRYRYSIWAQVWSSIEDDPNVSVLPANPHLQIGIDPTGNWDPGSPDIVWSPEASMTSIIDQWGLLTIEATAVNDVVTVFMRTNPDFANKHNDMYWDQAALEAVGPPEPTPLPPTETPGPPTDTPEPTNTLEATNTPEATVTPEPTNTLVPTNTPQPPNTATSIPEPTSTAEPSETPTATVTETPLPATDTPMSQPTDTPQPTPTSLSTEIAAIPTTADDTSNEDSNLAQEDDNAPWITVVVIVGIGLIILLLVAVLVVLLRQQRQN